VSQSARRPARSLAGAPGAAAAGRLPGAARLVALLLGALLMSFAPSSRAQSASGALASGAPAAVEPAPRPAAAARTTPSADAEGQLRAIRRALVEAAAAAPTRVISSAWIDERGALRETAQFHSQARVRGVRVSAYLRDDDPDWQAVADVELPEHLRAGVRPGAGCAALETGWRMPVALDVVVDPGLRGSDAPVAALLARELESWWLHDAGSSRRWLPVGQVLRTLPGQQPDDPRLTPRLAAVSYQAALLGEAVEPARWTDWRLRLDIARSRQGTGPMTLALSFARRDRAQPLWQSLWVVVPGEGARARSHLGAAELGQLRELLARWVAEADAVAVCEPPRFPLQRAATDRWDIPVGQGAGLRVGQRVLIADAQRALARPLEEGALDHLGLAEVWRVSERRTELRQIAGPPIPAGGDWIALPL
jgi:hypothetical protein